MNRPRHIMVACLILALTLTVFSGCIAPGGPEDLTILVHLEGEIFERIEDVSGRVEVHNPTNQEVSMYPYACPAFWVQRTVDQVAYAVDCLDTNDVDGPSTLEPGERFEYNFSLSGYWFYSEDGRRKVPADEFSPGNYGMRASAVRDAPESREVFFEITQGGSS